MSLLSIVQQASVELGLDSPSAAIGSGNVTYEQLAVLANTEGEELARAHDWRALLKTTFTLTGDGSTTLWALPSAFERFVIPYPLWEQDRPMFPLQGPLTSSEMLALQSANVNPPYYNWRLKGGYIEVYPALPSAKVISSEYISKNWCTTSDGVTEQSRFLTDADLALLDERLIRLGVIWRWKRAKGLDYAEELRTYDLEKMKRIGSDSGKTTINGGNRLSWFGTMRKNAYVVIS